MTLTGPSRYLCSDSEGDSRVVFALSAEDAFRRRWGETDPAAITNASQVGYPPAPLERRETSSGGLRLVFGAAGGGEPLTLEVGPEPALMRMEREKAEMAADYAERDRLMPDPPNDWEDYYS